MVNPRVKPAAVSRLEAFCCAQWLSVFDYLHLFQPCVELLGTYGGLRRYTKLASGATDQPSWPVIITFVQYGHGGLSVTRGDAKLGKVITVDADCENTFLCAVFIGFYGACAALAVVV